MMRRQHTKTAFTWLLGAACVLLAWVIYEELTELSVSELPEIADTAAPGKIIPIASPAVLSLPERDSLAVILERPVFAQSRRPSGGGEDGARAVAIDFTLSGVVITGNEQAALIRPADGAIVQLRIGQNIAGWTLVEIAADRVIVRRDEADAEIFLDYAAPAPPAPRTEVPKDASKTAPAEGNEDEPQMNGPGDPEAATNAETQN